MQWYITKGLLMTFPFFIAMGIVGQLVGFIMFKTFLKVNSTEENIMYRLNKFMKLTIWVCFIVGSFFFILMGMFYAAYTLSLTPQINKWIVITGVVIFLLLASTFTFREITSLQKKNMLFNDFDFFHRNKNKFKNYRQVINQNILHGVALLFPSYIFALIFNNLSNKLTFGLNSWLISLIK